MSIACVIDASVAIKWVITEEGSEAAVRLREQDRVFHAPDLLVPEMGNILWKKVQRGELTRSEAELACAVLRLANIELHAMGNHAEAALRMALALQHPVYDTTYLALAAALNVPMVTADRRLVNKVAGMGDSGFPEIMLLG